MIGFRWNRWWYDRNMSMHAICEMLTSSVDFVVELMWFLCVIQRIIRLAQKPQTIKIKTFSVHIIHFGFVALWHYIVTPLRLTFYSFVLFVVFSANASHIHFLICPSLLPSLDTYSKQYSILCSVIHFEVKHIYTSWC